MLWFDFLSLEVWRITVAVLAKINCSSGGTVRDLSPFWDSTHSGILYPSERFVVGCGLCKDQTAVQRLYQHRERVNWSTSYSDT